MDPLTVSAKFAAFVWFTQDQPDSQDCHIAARQFATRNWPKFLPAAHEGLGRLLLQIGRRASFNVPTPPRDAASPYAAAIY